MKFKRIFLMVLDSLGVGETTDAINFNDNGANTLKHINEECGLFIPNLKKIGFLDTVNLSDNPNVDAYYTIAKPINAGKDTLNGHYEMAGIKNDIPFKTFNQGFTYDILASIEEITGRSIIGNVCCNDDSVIKELGERQVNYGSLIVYTSADSDLQVAAHEDCIPIATLHEYCERIRNLSLREDWRIARIIARPFNGTPGKYKFINSKSTYSPSILKKPLKQPIFSNPYFSYSLIALSLSLLTSSDIISACATFFAKSMIASSSILPIPCPHSPFNTETANSPLCFILSPGIPLKLAFPTIFPSFFATYITEVVDTASFSR